MSPRSLLSSFDSIWLMVWEMWFEEFQDGSHGGHLGYSNRTILAILNFHNTPMPPIKFKLNQTYRLGTDVIWRFSRWLPWWPSWISEWNHFSNSKSRCCPNAFHRFCSIRLTVREQITTEDFQDGCHGIHHWCDSDGNIKNVKSCWQTYGWGMTMVNRPWHKLTTRDLQDGCCDGHRGYHNKMV